MNWISIILFYFSLQFIANSESNIKQYTTNEPSFEKDEEPPLWVDILFIFFSLCLHIIYGAKLIDYSLSHLKSEMHSKKKIEQITNDFYYEQLPHYTTKSDYDTESKPLKSPSFLCCIRCSPRIFTWARTLYIRQFLRFYMTISTLIATVFYFEFFGNFFLEFLVTILIHCRDAKYWYYTVSLLLLPEIIFVFRTYIWLSWHAVRSAWYLTSDENGDIESRRTDILKNTQHIVQQLKALKVEQRKRDSKVELVLHNEMQTNTVELQVKDTSKVETVELQEMKTETNDSVTSRWRLASIDKGIMVYNETVNAVYKLFGIDNPNQSDYIPDYFIGTCFRLWFFTITLISAMIATIFIGTELEFTSTFYGFGLRYMAIGGVLWCLIYTMYAFYFAIVSRLHNYKSIIKWDTKSIWNYILLIDVKDKQKEHKTWLIIKCLIVLFCTFGGIIFTLIGLILNEGFIIFIGIILMIYWWCNIFIISKPNSLINLLQGNIPPPSMRNHAHRIIEHKWKKLKQTNKELNIYAQNADSKQQKIQQIAIKNRNDIVKSVCQTLKGICNPREFMEEHNNNSNHKRLSSCINEQSIKELNVPFDSVIIEHALVYINLMKGYQTEQGQYKYHSFDQTQIRQLSVSDINNEQKQVEEIDIDTTKHEIMEVPVLQNNDTDTIANDIKETLQKDEQNNCCDYVSSIGYYTKYFKYLSSNYSNYWFKVYKPFEEFDITCSDQSDSILHGWQFLRYFTDKIDDKELNNLTRNFFKFEKKQKKQKKRCCGYCKKCLSNTCKKILDCACNLFILFAIIFCIGSIGWSSIVFNKELNDVNSNYYFQNENINNRNISQTYAICTDEYYASLSINDFNDSIEFKTYNILDLLYMIQGSYAMDNYNLTQLINKYFDENEFEIVYYSYDYPVFYHLKHKNQNLHFIVIRGTEDYFEYLQDLSLFIEAGLFQFLSFLLPYLNAMPTGFIRRIVYYSSLPEGLINSGARWHLYEKVYVYCNENIILRNDLYDDQSTIYLIGHSLGGAIANIVAAKLYDDYKNNNEHNMDVLAFGVASPGLLYSSSKFGFSMHAYDFTATSLLPRGEFVGKIDEHGGLIQNVACKHDKFYDCHKLHSPICEIYNNCPSHIVKNTNVFDCYCNGEKSKYQFGYCLNVTCIDIDGICV